MRLSRAELEQKASAWLKQGISPGQLALTLALGFTIGCVPVVGVPTVVCTAIALVLGLNLPMIQAATYIAMPFQLALIVPFLKLGTRVLAFGDGPQLDAGMLVSSPALKLAAHAGGLAGQAMVGWLLVAPPAAVIMTLGLGLALKKVPALKSEE
jgi:uncharacterized protein (DUF2062 family)